MFYRASFGDETKSVNAPDGTTISWETGARGIARFIPAAGRGEIIKTIVSASYSKSTIYPLTVGTHLFSIRDWGTDPLIEKAVRANAEVEQPVPSTPALGIELPAE